MGRTDLQNYENFQEYGYRRSTLEESVIFLKFDRIEGLTGCLEGSYQKIKLIFELHIIEVVKIVMSHRYFHFLNFD